MSQFSIIIPTCNRPHLLAKCLERLAPGVQTLGADQYRVIVTDDGKDHSAEEMVRSHFPWAAWVRGPRKGPAANRNNGAREARSDWLIFTDDDCIPDTHWAQAYADAVAGDRACSVFEGRTYADRPRQTLADVSPINETGGYLWSCNFAIRRTLFENMQGFDERFPHAAMEDVDLWRRLTDCGQTIRFVPKASVCHPWRTMRGARPLQQQEDSTLIYLQIHPAERRRINSFFYLKRHARLLVLDTLPGIVQCRGRGIQQALLTHLFGLKMACRLLKR